MPTRKYTPGWLCRDRDPAGLVRFFTDSRPVMRDGRWRFRRGGRPRVREAWAWWLELFASLYRLYEANGRSPSPALKPGECFEAKVEL